VTVGRGSGFPPSGVAAANSIRYNGHAGRSDRPLATRARAVLGILPSTVSVLLARNPAP
jgi:hypothetical protein